MHLSRRAFTTTGAAAAFAVLPPGASAQQKTPVIATFTILGDLVANVGGDRIALTTIVGPDLDTHAYQPTPADARTMTAARLLVINGLGFESWADRLARSASFTGTRVVATDGLGNALTRAEEDDKPVGTRRPMRAPRAVPDPHAWQDVAGARLYVRNIAAGLTIADPANAAYYRERAIAYDRRLAELDDWVRGQIATIAPDKRKVITGHDAFQYFARAYGVEFRAPVGISTDEQPSARDVAALVRQIRAEGIKAIFLENMSNPRLIEQITREAGAAVGPTLYVDALSAPGGVASTYEAMMRHNVPALVAGMRAN